MQHPSLRQIEAFRAVVETGTVKSAADMLHISQPAASKLLTSLERDVGLDLFDRSSGRLVMTSQGMKLYEEIDRIFSGVDQISRAVEMIRRENLTRLRIGVMPGLSGKFIADVVRVFRRDYPDAHVSIETRDSQFLFDWLVNRQIDVGIVMLVPDQTHVVTEPLSDEPYWCIMPIGHAMERLESISPKHLKTERIIGYAPKSLSQSSIEKDLIKHGLETDSSLEANTATSVCELVAAGLGVALVNPLMVEHVKGRVVYRRFRPSIENGVLIGRPQRARHAELTSHFISLAKKIAIDTIIDLGRDA